MIRAYARFVSIAIFTLALSFTTTSAFAEEAASEPAADASAASVEKTEETRTLGVVLFKGFELLDVYGPLEMWGNVGSQLKIVTVAAEKGAVASAQGPKTVADYAFADCPPLDLLLVPGGFGVLPQLNNESLKDFVRTRSADAEIAMSVCNGASILAAAGVLDGRPATTNKAYWNLATSAGPNVNWVAEARWVDDGNVVTSSGVSAGIDMTLHVIERLYGNETAMALANATEYEWHTDSTWDPFAKLHGLVDAEGE